MILLVFFLSLWAHMSRPRQFAWGPPSFEQDILPYKLWHHPDAAEGERLWWEVRFLISEFGLDQDPWKWFSLESLGTHIIPWPCHMQNMCQPMLHRCVFIVLGHVLHMVGRVWGSCHYRFKQNDSTGRFVRLLAAACLPDRLISRSRASQQRTHSAAFPATGNHLEVAAFTQIHLIWGRGVCH
jgi:hypothetical protein